MRHGLRDSLTQVDDAILGSRTQQRGRSGPPGELGAARLLPEPQISLHTRAFREIGLVWSADRSLAPAVRAFGDYAESGAVGAWSVRAGRGPIVLTA